MRRSPITKAQLWSYITKDPSYDVRGRPYAKPLQRYYDERGWPRDYHTRDHKNHLVKELEAEGLVRREHRPNGKLLILKEQLA